MTLGSLRDFVHSHSMAIAAAAVIMAVVMAV